MKFTRQFLFLGLSFLVFTCPGQENDSTRRKGNFAIYPALGYQPETSLQFGVVAVTLLKSKDESQDLYERRSSFTPYFLYTLRKQILIETDLDYFFRNGINLRFTPQLYNFPDVYYGIGNANDPDVNESYTNKYFEIEGQLFYPLNPITFVGLAWDLQYNNITDIEDNGLLDTDSPTGKEGGYITAIGPTFKYDSRDNAIYPTKGLLISSYIRPYFLGDFNFTSYWFDYRQYWKLGETFKNVFAVNVNVSFTSGDEVPFYKLPQLGGSRRLRGITNASLYRDKQLFFSQIEYRRHLFWRFGGVAFAGFGDVAENLGDYQFNELKYVVGVGGRFAAIPSQRLNLRLDMGIAKGGQLAFYVGLKESF